MQISFFIIGHFLLPLRRLPHGAVRMPGQKGLTAEDAETAEVARWAAALDAQLWCVILAVLLFR